MVNSINSKTPHYAGVNINCNVIDPTKLSPEDLAKLLSTPTYQGPPNNGGGCPCCSYPGNYYVNNWGTQPNQNTRKKRIQTITDQYIKNIEKFLNSPSEDMRKFGAQEVLKRLDEDRTRYNDAALNALINKMLQDPTCHIVKATALTALETQLAQGNDNTVKILTHMANNDKSRNGADAATATRILLKMSSPTVLVDAPNNSTSKGITE